MTLALSAANQCELSHRPDGEPYAPSHRLPVLASATVLDQSGSVAFVTFEGLGGGPSIAGTGAGLTYGETRVYVIDPAYLLELGTDVAQFVGRQAADAGTWV